MTYRTPAIGLDEDEDDRNHHKQEHCRNAVEVSL